MGEIPSLLQLMLATMTANKVTISMLLYTILHSNFNTSFLPMPLFNYATFSPFLLSAPQSDSWSLSRLSTLPSIVFFGVPGESFIHCEGVSLVAHRHRPVKVQYCCQRCISLMHCQYKQKLEGIYVLNVLQRHG